MFIDFLISPIGPIKIIASNAKLQGVCFVEQIASSTNSNDITNESKKQLQEYFANCRKIFDLPLEISGTEFQISVWRELSKLSFGEICSYGDISLAIGKPFAYRAVGMANSLNLFPIIIPCHRVIGADGKLGGYASGTIKKAWLLKHERAPFEC